MKLTLEPKHSAWLQLTNSPAVRQQQAAFACATGLALVLLPASSTVELFQAGKQDPIFCVQGCQGEHSGPVCQKTVLQAEQRAAKLKRPVTYRCPSGLTRIFVPVMVHGCHIGNLMAGPFSLTQAKEAVFQRLANRLQQLGLEGDKDLLDAAWRHTPILTQKRSQAVATLVNLFANYLGECGNQLMLQQAAQPSPLMVKIEAFLAEQRDEAATLKEVAERVNLSPCHFCKVFKKQTGLTFSEYRTRRQVEKVKQLLTERHLRVSEAAFEAGFNSIPYFNRAFRRYVGCPPSAYRERAMGTNEVKKTAIRA